MRACARRWFRIRISDVKHRVCRCSQVLVLLTDGRVDAYQAHEVRLARPVHCLLVAAACL